MKDLTIEISKAQVPEAGACLWWLAQAGFAFKSSRGAVLYLDPYLSEAVERAFGFKRLSPAPVAAEEVRTDWVIASHEHLDHCDTDALSIMAEKNPACRFAGPRSCQDAYAKLGIPEKRRLLFLPGHRYDLDGVAIHVARADHGALSPDALSLLLDFGQVRVLFTGDTAFNLGLMQPLIDRRPDVLIPCINGRFGNLDPEAAAKLTALVAPKLVIPCHFWMFKEHNGDPEAFCQACARLCPETPVRLLRPGEGLSCGPSGIACVEVTNP